ncbi:uncharacterized protein V1510DRAFT_411494 [Dipodascopsis tothii]|uniref:uncharacterized protein n=1 Tax=Dipodascopsis tothii TaxID=44089 RepID=UPI0034CDA420
MPSTKSLQNIKPEELFSVPEVASIAHADGTKRDASAAATSSLTYDEAQMHAHNAVQTKRQKVSKANGTKVEIDQDFNCHPSPMLKRRLSFPLPQTLEEHEDVSWVHSIKAMFIGLHLCPPTPAEPRKFTVGFSIHDGYYSTDFSVSTVTIPDTVAEKQFADLITTQVIDRFKAHSKDQLYKFVGVGLSTTIVEYCPRLCSRLWLELDVLPFVIPYESLVPEDPSLAYQPSCDEIADSLARKTVMYFGPSGLPRLLIGYRNKVEVDCNNVIRMLDLEDFKRVSKPESWECLTRLVDTFRKIKVNGHRGVRVAFFNATPQGGGVALMRHALIRLFRLLNLDVSWYVPRPNPAVFRITKNNHNIIQGVAAPETRLEDDQKRQFDEWIDANFQRYWASGPLSGDHPPGVDIAVMDDPQMVGLIGQAKKAGIKVIYRSHIQIRSDLVAVKGSPQEGVWNYLWDTGIQHADVFISHPVREFIPSVVPQERVGLLGATTDWLDGLNKDLSKWDTIFYMSLFKHQCEEVKANRLMFPMRPYICQIARFDPSKGIPDVLESYRKLRLMMEDLPLRKIPQLVIAGHSAVDDPDGTQVFDDTMKIIASPPFATISNDIVVMRVGPSDQMLNCLLSNATVVLQLSTREGFEVKVSEALHKGRPVVAYKAGGIPLQVQHGRNGYLVEVGDTKTVAEKIHELFMNEDLHMMLSEYAKVSVSDEVSTVGSAVSWLYMFNELASGREVHPNGGWIYDLMRERVGVPFKDGEILLPRDIDNVPN